MRRLGEAKIDSGFNKARDRLGLVLMINKEGSAEECVSEKKTA